MSEKIDKRLRATQFRERLTAALQTAELSQAALARQIGVDRSTISQLLTGTGARLPNAQVVGECAAALGVSADWLLSLSDRPETASALLANSLQLTGAPRAMIDEQIYDWHKEAAGYKIRHVPATLPDMLKTRDLLEWEYTPHLGRTTRQAIGAMEDRLSLLHRSPSDYEIAMPLFEVASFVHGEGYYKGLPAAVRRAQITRMKELHAELYPRLRIYLFDARRLFSSPITIFGPLLAALYVGRDYLTFRDTERITALTTHFDQLIREASVSARDFPDHLDALAAGRR